MPTPIPMRPPVTEADDQYLGIGLFAKQSENGLYRGFVRIRTIKDGVRCEQEYPCSEEREHERDAHTDALLLSLTLPGA
jgi:hypothetical protein